MSFQSFAISALYVIAFIFAIVLLINIETKENPVNSFKDRIVTIDNLETKEDYFLLFMHKVDEDYYIPVYVDNKGFIKRRDKELIEAVQESEKK